MWDFISIGWQAWEFLKSDAGVGIIVALFALSEALASIPQIKANSVFQGVYHFLAKLAKKDIAAASVMLLLVGCTGFTVEQFNLGETLPGKVYKTVELYKVNPFAPSYTYHMIFQCEPSGENCQEVARTPTISSGAVPVSALIQAGEVLGGASILANGIRKSGSQTTVSGGNASASSSASGAGASCHGNCR